MCTSIVVNRFKPIVGWNLDLLDMEHRVRVADEGVFIEISDPKEGWLPIFGANARGDFAGLPTCWPYDARSDPEGEGWNTVMLNIDLLLQKKSFQQIRSIAEKGPVFSVPGVTFMQALSDRDGNVLHIVPGQGFRYYERPDHQVLTNFSPFKMDSEQHPWMGWDRYQKAEYMIQNGPERFGVEDCLAVLEAVSQTVCPTVVSMVFDPQESAVFWCENRQWDRILSARLRFGTSGPSPE
ncbi:MAG: hypothetical protein IJR83_02370 [Clostridia bacterium]|nr:hypothetical protein [Clostridia bacterium]